MIRPALFYCLVAVVPLAALWLATPPERAEHGLAVKPFGWPSVLLVQCLAAVALAAVAARRLTAKSVLVPVIAGVLFAIGGHFASGMIGDSLDSFPADFAARCVVRSLFCFVLALPWAVAARVGSSPAHGSWVRAAVALVVAFILPGVWADKLAKETTDAAVDELAARRTTRAARLVDGACDLDPFRMERVNGPKHLIEFRGELASRQKRLAEHLAAQPPDPSHPNDRLQYANDLLSLDRLEEAEAVLRELIPTLPPANLPLARVLHLRGRYAESDAAARELLAVGLPVANTKPSIRKACVDAYDLLAENATRRGSHADREVALKEGLEKLPADAAYFHFQLGRHFKMAGRPFDAVRELNEAVNLDKSFESSAQVLMRDIREGTPGCLIGR